MENVLLALTICFVLAQGFVAQEPCECWAPLRGRVVDDSGRGVYRARVTVHGCLDDPACQTSQTRTRYTNTFGYFDFGEVAPSGVAVEVRAKGFDYYLHYFNWWEFSDLEIVLDPAGGAL